MKTIGMMLRWCAKQFKKIPDPGPGAEFIVIPVVLGVVFLGALILTYPLQLTCIVLAVLFLRKCWNESKEHDKDE